MCITPEFVHMHKLNCGLTALKDTYVYMYTYPYPLQDDEGNARTDPKCAYWKFDSKYVCYLDFVNIILCAIIN